MPKQNPVDRMARWLGDQAGLLFLAAVAFMFYEVVMRYGFNAPTVWVHEVTIGISAVAFVLAGAYTMQRGDHIRITIVYDRFLRGGRHVLDVLNSVIAVVYLASLGYGAWLQAARSLAVGERTGTASNLPIPVILKTVLALGVVLMALQTALTLRNLLRGKE